MLCVLLLPYSGTLALTQEEFELGSVTIPATVEAVYLTEPMASSELVVLTEHRPYLQLTVRTEECVFDGGGFCTCFRLCAVWLLQKRGA